MSTNGDEADTTSVTAPGTDPVTVVQARASAPAATTAGLDATVVTAEIPVVAPPARNARSRVGTPAYERPADPVEVVPAPVALRLAVWVLFFVFLVALIALAVDHFHPDWLSFLRRGVSNTALGATRFFA